MHGRVVLGTRRSVSMPQAQVRRVRSLDPHASVTDVMEDDSDDDDLPTNGAAGNETPSSGRIATWGN
eukprot:1595500-Lingulodinium_polyedra.AAC.1